MPAFMAFCTRRAKSIVLALRVDSRILRSSEHFLGKSNIILMEIA
jgi:hypothetical protein